MGMAASQARYLALTARKTNTEYEGQQINQARTALANQSANLFNRLLNLNVPNPPKTTDYTKVQYSYSDGENASVIDEWQQLSGVNPDYNYIVKSHYMASLYTGMMKKMTDPQVQIQGANRNFDAWNTIALNKDLLDAANTAQQDRYNQLQSTKAREEADILTIRTNALLNNTEYSDIDSAINKFTIAQGATGYDTYTLENTATGKAYTVKYYNNPIAISTAAEAGEAQSVLQGVRDMLDTNLIDFDTLNEYLSGTGIYLDSNNISQLTDSLPRNPGDGYNQIQEEVLKLFGLESDASGNTRLVSMDDVQRIVNDPNVNGVTAHTHYLSGTFLSSNDQTIPTLNSFADDIRTNHIANITAAQNAYEAAHAQYQALLDNYENNITKPTYIGNSPLTPLTQLTDDQRTELLQVVKDMKAENIDTDIINCFDAGNNYLGGIYSFEMNGVTYYTTQNSLQEAYNSYPRNRSNNVIDGQYKMPYYNASYIDKRIEKQSYALLETDGNGRFKSVKFDNDSVVYSLNTETITDEAAYQDAMNKYLYEKEKYEKTIADINAKTSIIQKEDRTLELRLKQLDTEQNALKTEMDAVKKVIKDNVDSTFKTFSD